MRNSILLLLAIQQAAAECGQYCSSEFDSAAYCMSDSQIYPNHCHATCNKKQLRLKFVCNLGQGVDLNFCQLQCHVLSQEAAGKLFGNADCRCPRVYRPVCGENGSNYFNDCFRRCNKVKLKSEGFCTANPKTCRASPVYRPVCAADGKTYANQELAACDGAKAVTDGRCGAIIQRKTAEEAVRALRQLGRKARNV